MPRPVSALPTPALHDSQTSRQIETLALATQPAAGALMARAGLAVARLALALGRPTGTFWVLCGPGNNGGDGLVAARWLHRHGHTVRVVFTGQADTLPPDACQAHAAALAAGVLFCDTPPDEAAQDAPPRLVIDALLGLGQRRPPAGRLGELVTWCNRQAGPVLAVDLPTGLDGDTGQSTGGAVVRATATVSLLTLKPGLFTGIGQDVAGTVWWDDLAAGQDIDRIPPTARLTEETRARHLWPLRLHQQHKGSFGDLWVLAGAPGMTGAAFLAGRAGLTGGAGRVYVSLLDERPGSHWDPIHPELMFRPASGWQADGVLEQATVVCGCGGGEAVAEVLPQVLHRAHRLVLDADALNAIAQAPALQQALQQRASRSLATVLTPHPLEAARLAGLTVAQIQGDRIAQACALAKRFQAVVLLKGSGTVISAPGGATWINPTGHAALATPGSGDVLAGWLGATWAAQPEQGDPVQQAHDTAAATAWLHGRAAEQRIPHPRLPLLAGDLIQAMAAALQAPEAA
ncbi:NAD(P)H-hydrate dehydratase [Ideonella sp. B7]|uniref:NAD(P)H-hydrate dehydratase n=1 Tax=Ideonella benzenivorans TaxID=2831643 RepID=UPI001CEC18DA|nr:NAD(P)H-hydrate dehydratase [Ideonella benzenivorans]MCA6217561.1 NAD(P)H-hydrate dehydratase [Ideonella benzenivorans]